MQKKDLLWLFIFSSLMGVLFVVLFFDINFVGINYFIYALSFILILLYFFRKNEKFNIKLFIIMSTIILMLSSIYFRSSFDLFKFFNFLLIPILFAYLGYISLVKKSSKNFIIDIISQLFVSIEFIDKFLKKLIDIISLKLNINKNSKIKGIIIGLLICIIIAIIIIPLMINADFVFKYFIKNFSKIFEDLNPLNMFSKIFISLLVASYFFAFVCHIFKNNNVKPIENLVKEQNQIIENKEKDFIISETICNTILMFLNLLFLFFSIIQFNYLFLKNVDTLPLDFTYAQYARSGFFQMLALTIINFLIIMIVRFLILKNKALKYKATKILLTIITFSNFVMISSAFYRMFLYESTYGYTRLRLLVYLFLILETILMTLVLYGIWKVNFNIIRNGIIVTMVFYLIINFINIDGYIAKKNIDRYYETGKLDIHYIVWNLSDDSLHQISRLINDESLEIRTEVNKRFSKDNRTKYKWQEFNIARINANKLYEKY